MSYMLIEFEEADGGGLAVVASKWVTPRKKEVFWPPTKDQKFYKKALKSLQEPDIEKWSLYKISRQFYETENLGKAEEKLKLAQITSDLATDSEVTDNKRKRKLKKPTRFISSSSNEDDDEEDYLPIKRPPLIKLNENGTNGLLSQSYSVERSTNRPVNSQCSQQIQEEAHSSRYFSPQRCVSDTNNLSSQSHSKVLKYRSPAAISSQFSEPSQESHTIQQHTAERNQSGFAERSLALERISFDKNIINTPQSSTDTLRISLNNETPHGIPTVTRRGDELEFRSQILTLLNVIKEQNIQILNYIKNKDVSKTVSMPADFPVQLPLNHQTNIECVEEYLKHNENLSSIVVYLNSLGGKDCTSKTNRILKTIFTNDLARQYSFYGKRLGKIPFCNLLLKEAVTKAVKLNNSGITDKEVEDSIKIWLKHAPQRLVRENGGK